MTPVPNAPRRPPTSGPSFPVIGDLAPNFASLTDSVLYDETWNDPLLTHRERSLITVASLLSLYRKDQLEYHLRRALENGLTAEELVAAITHLAFYAGWPAAMTALHHLQTVLAATKHIADGGSLEHVAQEGS